MCFSLTASFTAAALLIPAGIVASIPAIKYNHKFILLALIPVIFGIQQFIEGITWYGLNNHHTNLTHTASLTYLFFAFFLWPVCFPLSAWLLEENPVIRKKILLLTVAGFLLGVYLYLPILLNNLPVSTSIAGNSIDYLTYQSHVMVPFYIVLYVAITFLALIIASSKRMNILGWLVVLSAIVSMLCYKIVFTSVWCFFAAILSLYIIYIVYAECRQN